MKYILWLDDVDKNSVALAGGKGANLGELKKAGFYVPDGFVISCALYNKIALKNGFKEKIEIPKDAEKEILDAYRKLGGPAAIRSSATTEDSKAASFAGQQDTFLNVDESALIESVKNCMESLFSPRAVSYRQQKNLASQDASIAVVVQKMIDSKKAGVAFSVNPVTGNKGEIIIEAATGSGARVVGGEIIPDNYVIAKESGKITGCRLAKEPVLSDSEISALSALVKAIEKHYYSPQDVEWAIDAAGKIHILQARPITTFNIDTKQKPVWKKIMAREYGVQYTEMSLRSLSPECSFVVPAPFYGQVYIPEDKNEALYVNEAEWGDFVSSLKKTYAENPENYESFEKQFMETGRSYVRTAEKIAGANLKEKAASELKKYYLKYQKTSLGYAPFIWIQFLINNFFAEAAKEIMARKAANAKDANAFCDAALKPGKKASAIVLSEIALKWDSLDDEKRNAVYEKYKWIPCMDIHNRPWTKEEFEAHIRDFKKPAKKAEFSYEHLMAVVKPSKQELQILDIAKRLAYLKDLKDDFRRQGVFYGRALFEEIANRMAIKPEDTSYLLESEIFGFLDGAGAPSKAVIESRKAGFVIYYASQKKIACKSGNDVQPVLGELGISAAAASQKVSASGEIKGVPASLGRAKGTARIITSVSELAKVKKGDILIAITTHPDFVPAMQKAAAIVTDEGGITCHAAIVAREFGLPCIVGTKNATKSLKDGDEIEVDANLGIVRKIKN